MAKTYRTLYFKFIAKNHKREPSNFPDSPMQLYRIGLGVLIFIGSLMTIDIVWALLDFFMVIMTVVNLTSLFLLGKYAVTLLEDYKRQLKAGKDPQYQSSTIPEISEDTECW